MQKFHANDFNTLYEDVLMSPGDKLPAHLNCLLRRGKRQEARGNSKGIGGDSANLKNKRFVFGWRMNFIPSAKYSI